MEPHEYEKMAEVEDRMWWYRSLHRNLLFVLQRFLPGRDLRIVDAGCGTGGLLGLLAAERHGDHLVGLDAWQHACTVATTRSRRPVVRGLFQALPFADASLDCVVSADVLCHANVDPPAALREVRRCLRRDGIFVVNLPAYQWMLSYHDVRVQNARRFTRGHLGELLSAAGLLPLYATYWNTLLFPIMAARRLLPASEQKESDVHAYAPAADACCRALLTCERGALRAGIRLPFGGSVLAVARRDDG